MSKKAEKKLVSAVTRLTPQNGEGILGALTTVLSLGVVSREILGVPKLGNSVFFFYVLFVIGILIILDSSSGQKALHRLLGE